MPAIFPTLLLPKHRLGRRWFTCLGWLLMLTGQASVLAQDPMLRQLQADYNQKITPILQQYCIDCHQGDSASASFNLDQFQQLDQILKARKRWRKLEKRVTARQMPPEDGEPLSETDYQILTQWLDQLLNSADCINIDPGRVTLRRLNRIEYQNTIRDLLGVDYQPAAEFPGDDVGYGFDNIADVMSLPPILLEKYLSAAEELTHRAILDPQVKLLEQQFEAQDFSTEQEVSLHDDRLVFFTNAALEQEVVIPQTGTYQITAEVAGDQAGDEPVRMSIRPAGKRGVQRKVRSRSDKPENVEVELRLAAGKQTLQVSFDNDFYQEASHGKQAEDRNLILYRISIAGPMKPILPESHLRLLGKSLPESEAEQLKHAEQILHRIGSRAFRRGLRAQERNQLLQIFSQARQDGESFAAAIRYSLQAILVSPHFLFKIELPLQPGETRELNDFELATSLSYFLWSSMPDEELFRLASKKELQKPEVYRQQVNRMLTDPKSVALVDNFVGQWLQLRKLEQFQPDPVQFPGVDLQLRQDMIKETKLLFTDLIQNQRSVLDLLNTEYTYVNQRLSAHYGLPAIEGEEFKKVSTKEFGRIGLLTQASILTVTSNPTRTSPVKRGKWIMENLLGDEPPPPDPAAMPIEDQPELKGNLRQRMEQHRADPNCAVCHQVMDQLGFALENFDAVGRWRDTDEGHAVDASGALPSGQRFSGALEMQRVIRDDLREDFVRCLTEKMLIYATGRGLEYFDECAIDKIVEELKNKNYTFDELIQLIAASEPFRKRRG